MLRALLGLLLHALGNAIMSTTSALFVCLLLAGLLVAGSRGVHRAPFHAIT